MGREVRIVQSRTVVEGGEEIEGEEGKGGGEEVEKESRR